MRPRRYSPRHTATLRHPWAPQPSPAAPPDPFLLTQGGLGASILWEPSRAISPRKLGDDGSAEFGESAERLSAISMDRVDCQRVAHLIVRLHPRAKVDVEVEHSGVERAFFPVTPNPGRIQLTRVMHAAS